MRRRLTDRLGGEKRILTAIFLMVAGIYTMISFATEMGWEAINDALGSHPRYENQGSGWLCHVPGDSTVSARAPINGSCAPLRDRDLDNGIDPPRNWVRDESRSVLILSDLLPGPYDRLVRFLPLLMWIPTLFIAFRPSGSVSSAAFLLIGLLIFKLVLVDPSTSWAFLLVAALLAALPINFDGLWGGLLHLVAIGVYPTFMIEAAGALDLTANPWLGAASNPVNPVHLVLYAALPATLFLGPLFKPGLAMLRRNRRRYQ